MFNMSEDYDRQRKRAEAAEAKLKALQEVLHLTAIRLESPAAKYESSRSGWALDARAALVKSKE